MKRLFASLAALVILAVTSGAAVKQGKTIPASDSRVVWIGRTYSADSGAVSFDWSATYARISFEGDILEAVISDTDRNMFNVWIDRPMSAEPDRIITTEGDARRIVLADRNDFIRIYGRHIPAGHQVIIQKRSEGRQGIVTVKEFICNGDFTEACPPKQRVIEFVGDSYTCGYGSENSISSDRFSVETENCSKAYAAILSRYFDADYITICHSGQGVVRNYNDQDPKANMPLRYRRTFDSDEKAEWNPEGCSVTPDITVIYLGTNDFSVNKQPTYTAFKRNYLSLLRQIKKNYGEGHPVLCVSSKVDDHLFDYVRGAVLECGMKNVRYCGLFNGLHHDDNTELGADFHPNYKAHKKLAYALIPYIATMTDWETEDRTVE